MLAVVLITVTIKFHRIRKQLQKEALNFRTSFMQKSLFQSSIKDGHLKAGAKEKESRES